jgi:hypothetical protein
MSYIEENHRQKLRREIAGSSLIFLVGIHLLDFSPILSLSFKVILVKHQVHRGYSAVKKLQNCKIQFDARPNYTTLNLYFLGGSPTFFLKIREK